MWLLHNGNLRGCADRWVRSVRLLSSSRSIWDSSQELLCSRQGSSSSTTIARSAFARSFIPGQASSVQRDLSSRAQLAVAGRHDWKSCTFKVEPVIKSVLHPFSLLRCRKALREACQHRMDVRRGAQQGSLSVSLGSRASTALPHYSSWRRFLC